MAFYSGGHFYPGKLCCAIVFSAIRAAIVLLNPCVLTEFGGVGVHRGLG
jgi:hypothetical protein